jgi:hypothetical protein
MGTFWGSRQVTPQPQPQQPPPQQASPWWQDGQVQQPQHQLMQPGSPVMEYTPKGKLKSRGSAAAGNCPECDSTNYMVTGRAVTQHGSVEVTRCFSCGYPVENSTRGMQGSGGGDSDGRARQIPGAGGVVHNYHPETIVDIAPGQRGPRTQ